MNYIKFKNENYPYILDLYAIERIEDQLDKGIFGILSSMQDSANVRFGTLKCVFHNALISGADHEKRERPDEHQVMEILEDLGIAKFIKEISPIMIQSMIKDSDSKKKPFKEQMKTLRKKPISET